MNYSVHIHHKSKMPENISHYMFNELFVYPKLPEMIKKRQDMRDWMILETNKTHNSINLNKYFNIQDEILMKTLQNVSSTIENSELILDIKFDCSFDISHDSMVDYAWRYGIGEVFRTFTRMSIKLLGLVSDEEIENMFNFTEQIENNLTITCV